MQQNRGHLLAAILTIGRARYARGQPTGQVVPWGTYHGWAEALGGMLLTAGIPGFLANLDELDDSADADTAGWIRVLDRWATTYGDKPIRVADVATMIALAGSDLELPPALATALGSTSDPATRNARLSAQLKARAGTALAGDDETAGDDEWRAGAGAPSAVGECANPGSAALGAAHPLSPSVGAYAARVCERPVCARRLMNGLIHLITCRPRLEPAAAFFGRPTLEPPG